MDIKILQEAGYELAKYGFSLSYKDRAIKPEEWWCPEVVAGWCCEYTDCGECTHGKKLMHYDSVLQANANRGNGHNKFRRQIMLWVDIEAPRYWWSEFDTYKVGTVAQSESTMHTLTKRDVTSDDFDGGMLPKIVAEINGQLKVARQSGKIVIAKRHLPESYLQRRLVTMNYEVLAAIINQRKNHKLPEWKKFIDAAYSQVEHPELLPKMEE